MDRRNVLFSLKPRNIAAREMANLHSNRHLLHKREQVLDLGHYRSEAAGDETHCIVTIGRDGDIVVPWEWTAVSRDHCRFVIGAAGVCITFVDKSSNASCQAYGGEGNTQELLSSSSRQVDSSSGLCRIVICISGMSEPKTAEFDIVWHYPASGLASALQAWRRVALPRRPKLNVTQIWPVGEVYTKTQHSVVATTGDQTSAGDLARFELAEKPIGRGTFGAVFPATDPKSNTVVAVKVLQPLNPRQWHYLDREVRIMRKLCHPNIVECLGHKVDGARTEAHIFMSLQNGSLEDLVNERRPVQMSDQSVARIAYHDMLKGLDYLHWKGFIHRDLKPANVLYTMKNNRPLFCLADFGLANSKCFAQSFCGTQEFMAPEVFYRQKYTTAVDLWSLLMTILWTLDLAHYRSHTFQEYPSFLEWVVSIIREHWDALEGIRELAVINSRKRARAAQMLLEHFQGDGLTTDRQKVLELQPVEAPDIRDLKIVPGSRPTIAPARINRAPLEAGVFKRPAIRQDLFGRNVVPMAQPLCGQVRPIFSTKTPRRRNLFITNIQGRGGVKKVVLEENATHRHPAARVAREYSPPPKASLVSRKPPVTDGVQKRKALKKGPPAGSKADAWFKEVFKIPGAFPA